MPGPAQKYFIYGLQAARESADPRAPLLVVSILSDMAQQMRWLDRMKAAMQLYDLAIGQIPADRRRFNVVGALLTAKRVQDSICHLGSAYVSEVRSAMGKSFELYARADDEDRATAATLWHRALDMSEAIPGGYVRYDSGVGIRTAGGGLGEGEQARLGGQFEFVKAVSASLAPWLFGATGAAHVLASWKPR